ncbi:MAG: hypothetical protein H7195_04630 [Chryseobacterium sp.]|nr:hypothetical protein [Chryseobacterium sp.]
MIKKTLFFKKYFGLFSVLLLLIASSCTRYMDPDSQVNSNWQGQYYGTFTGDQTGTILLSVSKTGSIDGTIKRSNYPDDEFGGYVSANGKFDFNSRGNFYFSGFLDKVTQSAGSWYNSTGGKGNYIIKLK